MPIAWDEDKSAYANGPAIADQPPAAAAPTKAEFDASRGEIQFVVGNLPRRRPHRARLMTTPFLSVSTRRATVPGAVRLSIAG